MTRNIRYSAIHTLVLLALIISSTGSTLATETTIGAGTGAGNVPFWTSSLSCRAQTIYLASEISGPLRITSLALNVDKAPGIPVHGLTIRMKHTTLSSYASPVWESSGWTTVYHEDEEINATGWHTLVFTTPFEYNGVDNLMVDISFQNTTTSTSGLCRYSVVTGNRILYAYGPANPLTWSGSSPAGSQINRIVNIKLSDEFTATPVFSPKGGNYSYDPCVRITCPTPGVTIHYTTNGLDPTESDPIIASGGSVTVHPPTILKAKAWYPGWVPSGVRTEFYDLPVVATPRFNPPGGAGPLRLDVIVGCETPGAAIHYTTNGLEPTENDPIVVSGSVMPIVPPVTLKAKAWKTGMNPSLTGSATYTVGRLPTPSLNMAGGDYPAPFNVYVASEPGSVIHYTTNGVDPTESDPSVPSGSWLWVDENMTLKAKAWKADWLPSYVGSRTYMITPLTVDTPEFTPDEGTYTDAVNVRVTCSTSCVLIHYTTNGLEPTENDPRVSSGSTVYIGRSAVLKARAWKTDCNPSATKSACYTIAVATPVFAPNGGSHDLPANVTITCPTPSAVIHYTTNGTPPTEIDPVIASGSAILVGHTMRLSARAWKTGLSPSDVRSADYTITHPLSVSETKTKPDGAIVASSGPVVSAVFPEYFYVEAGDRSCGLRVDRAGHSLGVGMRADITGTLMTNLEGERYIQAATALEDGSGCIEPLALPNRAIGGGDWRYAPLTGTGQKGLSECLTTWVDPSTPITELRGLQGLNNIGLLVQTTGLVTHSESGYFYIDDGSALNDGSGCKGIRVLGQVPVAQGENPIGRYVKVTGISSCFKSGSDLFRLVRATGVVVVPE